MKQLIFISLFTIGASITSAQEAYFKAEIKKSEIESREVFRVDFIIKNIRGEFQAPDFHPFELVGGPNQSSSIQIINGDYFQEYRYSYFLRAPEPGIYFIPEANLLTEEDILESEPVEILVLAEGEKAGNKQGIQDPQDSLNRLEEILKRKQVKKF